MINISNCLNCCCHIDNKDWKKCSSSKHCFRISEKQKEKFEWAAKYINDELESGRDVASSLGSAGLTFVSDIKNFANYCYGNGYKNLYERIND